MSIEELIKQQVGIKSGANDLTPMDYLECKTIAEKYASQQVQEYKENLTSKLQTQVAGLSMGTPEENEIYTLKEVIRLINVL